MSDPTRDFGPKPELMEVHVDRLSVESKYQRDTGSTRSRKVIAKIIEDFRWPRFGALLVVRHKSATRGRFADAPAWHVIDGQHRVEAVRALHRAGLLDGRVPCIELPHGSIREAAADFVAINRDRVAVTPLHIHHAEVAAGLPEALAIQRCCDAAGLKLTRGPRAIPQMKPGETSAIGAVRAIVKKNGEAGAIRIFAETIRKYGQGPIEAGMLRAVAGGGIGAGDNSKPAAAPTSGFRQRRCLSCAELFESSGINERVCPNCKGTAAWRGASIE